MKLYTKVQFEKLIANGGEAGEDHKPVVKLFTPDAAATWLLSEIDPDNHSLAFGLCDLGVGFPELGWVSLEELGTVRGKLGLPVERDLHFKAVYPLSVYAELARKEGWINTDPQKLRAIRNEMCEN